MCTVVMKNLTENILLVFTFKVKYLMDTHVATVVSKYLYLLIVVMTEECVIAFTVAIVHCIHLTLYYLLIITRQCNGLSK